MYYITLLYFILVSEAKSPQLCPFNNTLWGDCIYLKLTNVVSTYGGVCYAKIILKHFIFNWTFLSSTWLSLSSKHDGLSSSWVHIITVSYSEWLRLFHNSSYQSQRPCDSSFGQSAATRNWETLQKCHSLLSFSEWRYAVDVSTNMLLFYDWDLLQQISLYKSWPGAVVTVKYKQAVGGNYGV